MTELEFYQGWAVLTSQEFARFFAFDEERYELQTRLYRSAIIGHSSTAWEQTVTWWVSHERTWPLLPDVLGLIQKNTPKPQPTTDRQLTHQENGETPWREVVQAWIRGEGSIRSVASRIVPAWIERHPGDFDARRQWETWIRKYGYGRSEDCLVTGKNT